MVAPTCAFGQRRFAELFLIKFYSKIGFEMSLIVVEAICGRCASFMILTATVSEIFGGQANSSILVAVYILYGFVLLEFLSCYDDYFVSKFVTCSAHDLKINLQECSHMSLCL